LANFWFKDLHFTIDLQVTSRCYLPQPAFDGNTLQRNRTLSILRHLHFARIDLSPRDCACGTCTTHQDSLHFRPLSERSKSCFAKLSPKTTQNQTGSRANQLLATHPGDKRSARFSCLVVKGSVRRACQRRRRHCRKAIASTLIHALASFQRTELAQAHASLPPGTS
jgi:hypothetical protein